MERIDPDMVAGFDGERAFAFCRTLARPRAAGTAGEAAAGSLLAKTLGSFGLPVQRQTFAYNGRVVPAYGRCVALLAALGFLSLLYCWRASSPLAFLPAALLAQVVLARVFAAPVRRILEKGLRPVQSSFNVITSVGPSRPASRLVLVAHYDQYTRRLPMAVAFLCTAVNQVAAIVACALTYGLHPYFVALGSTVVVGGGPQMWLVIGLLTSLPLLWDGPVEGPGAMDNASGCASLVELARVMAARRPKNLQVEFLFTAAEETGLWGMRKYMEELGDGPAHPPIEFLNLDIPFHHDGTASLVTGFGLFQTVPTSFALNDALRRSALALGTPLRELRIRGPIEMDQRIPLEAGYEATGLLARNMRMHHRSDSMEAVPREAFAQLGRMILHAVAALDEALESDVELLEPEREQESREAQGL